MKNNRKGFTMAELLIVVAIIAVLVAVAIPVFGSQLEKAQQATNVANVRSLYGDAMSQALADSMKAGTYDSQTATFNSKGFGDDPSLPEALDGLTEPNADEEKGLTLTIYDDGTQSWNWS